MSRKRIAGRTMLPGIAVVAVLSALAGCSATGSEVGATDSGQGDRQAAPSSVVGGTTASASPTPGSLFAKGVTITWKNAGNRAVTIKDGHDGRIEPGGTGSTSGESGSGVDVSGQVSNLCRQSGSGLWLNAEREFYGYNPTFGQPSVWFQGSGDKRGFAVGETRDIPNTSTNGVHYHIVRNEDAGSPYGGPVRKQFEVTFWASPDC